MHQVWNHEWKDCGVVHDSWQEWLKDDRAQCGSRTKSRRWNCFEDLKRFKSTT